MTDYFALLEQPRAAWLDSAALKEAYHRKTLQLHPDTGGNQTADAGASFAQVNEAYQVLENPKRRLHHLLALESATPSAAPQAVPPELQDLFGPISELTQSAKLLIEKSQSAANALAKSLMRPEQISQQQQTDALRAQLKGLLDQAFTELRQLDDLRRRDPEGGLDRMTKLYFRFAYLERWLAQLDELKFQLSSC